MCGRFYCSNVQCFCPYQNYVSCKQAPGGQEASLSATEVKLIGRWSYGGVMNTDLDLTDYIVVSRSANTFISHARGRYQAKRVRKALYPHRRAPQLLHEDARPEQRHEAHGRAHREARL